MNEKKVGPHAKGPTPEDGTTSTASHGAGPTSEIASLEGREFGKSVQLNGFRRPSPDQLATAAAEFADRGWRVLPVHWMVEDQHSRRCSCREPHWLPKCPSAGKHPVDTAWQRFATTELQQVATWWGAEYPDANVGIATGRESGIWVLDIDPDHDGGKSIERLETEHEPLPDTRRHRTGSGGVHYVFAVPDGVTIRSKTTALGPAYPGVDTRGEGGQFVAPPSVSAKGAYSVLDGRDPVSAPAWLVELLQAEGTAEWATNGPETPSGDRTGALQPARVSAPTGDRFDWGRALTPGAVPVGEQDDALARAAASCRANGDSDQRAVDLLHRVVDAFTNEPGREPWTHAHAEDKWRRAKASYADGVTLSPAMQAFASGALVPQESADGGNQWLSDEQREWLTDDVVRAEIARLEQRRRAKEIHAAYIASKNSVPVPSVKDIVQQLREGKQISTRPTVGLIEGDPQLRGLFYSGRVNVVFGGPSVAKSVLMSEVQARELNAGGTVVHWEYDNNPGESIVMRLVNAGADLDAIAERFHIVTSLGDRDALGREVIASTALVTLDAVDPAIGALGEKVNDTNGMDTVIRECFQPFTRHGACGLAIDHVGLESTERQAGSRRKKTAVQGASYLMKRGKSLKPGQDGFSTLTLHKDNVGALGDEDKILATVRMHSEARPDGGPGRVVTAIRSALPESATFEDARDIAEAHRPAQGAGSGESADGLVMKLDAAKYVPSSVRDCRNWMKTNKITAPNDVVSEAVRRFKERRDTD